MTEKTNFQWLQEWYFKQTNDDWEHQYGVEIGTLDNPGWRVKIDLDRTNLFEKEFSRIKIERSETDWFHIWVEKGKFEIACGPLNLEEAFGYFRNWVEGKT